jgi:hypothetical protein
MTPMQRESVAAAHSDGSKMLAKRSVLDIGPLSVPFGKTNFRLALPFDRQALKHPSGHRPGGEVKPVTGKT